MFTYFDTTVFAFLNGYVRYPVLDLFMPLISEPLLPSLCLLMFLVGYWFYCERNHGEALWRVTALVLFLALCALVAWLLCDLLGAWHGRLRPFESLPGTYRQVGRLQWEVVAEIDSEAVLLGDSFPSLWACLSMAFAVAISVLFRRSNPWIYLIPILVGWSRVYLGANFPLDVLCGWLLGIVAVFVVWWVNHFLISRLLPNHRRPRPRWGQPRS